ncbi:MAG: HAD hydrolase-like protein, partial [Hyphomonadaceae bacterium]|nr:HAD hydrolase-like protein [Hyphomonadaceae bacterium]
MQITENSSKPLSGWTIVFDLDGTLVESAPDLLNALNHTIATLGIAPVQLDDIRTMIGHGAKAMIREALTRAEHDFTEDKIEPLWEMFLAHYRANIAVDSHLFEGVKDGLDALQAQGANLAVCTNKTQSLSEQLLENLNILQYFKAVIGADSVPAKKPDAGHLLTAVSAAGGDPARALLVG